MSAQTDSTTTFRRMTDADLATVVAIESDVHQNPWTRGNFADSMQAGYHCWIAERDAQTAGYGVIMIAAGEGHLLNLSVARSWQRHGIGTELARFLLKLARDYGAQKLFLEVRPSNTAARALYMRSGLSEIAVRRDYYPADQGREDAIVMELTLT